MWRQPRRILGQNLDPIGPLQSTDDSSEEIGPCPTAVEQGDPQSRQVVSDHQSWQTATRAEIEDRCIGSRRRPARSASTK